MVLEGLGGDVIDLFGHHRFVFDDLFEQGVVEIGVAFEQFGAGLFLAGAHRLGDLHQRRMLAVLELPGAFGDQVDHADDVLAVADRHFAQHDMVARIGLQRRDGFRHPADRRVGLVDEDDRGHLGLLDHAQVGRGQHRAVGIGRYAEHDGIGGRERGADGGNVLGAAGNVDRRPVLAHEPEGADRGDARHIQRFPRRPVETDKRFEQRGFAGGRWAYDGKDSHGGSPSDE